MFLLPGCSGDGGEGPTSRGALAEAVEVASVWLGAIGSMEGLTGASVWSAEIDRAVAVSLGAIIYGMAITRCGVLLLFFPTYITFFFSYMKHLQMLSSFPVLLLFSSAHQPISRCSEKRETFHELSTFSGHTLCLMWQRGV